MFLTKITDLTLTNMRKFYLVMAMALIGSLAFGAQRAPLMKKSGPMANRTSAHSTSRPVHSASRVQPSANHSSTVLWSDDFSNASNWVFATEAGTTDNWVISTTGPSGTYAINSIASATAANGFAMFDSDLMCSGNQIGDLTTANSINCSSYPNVRLVFSQYYRRYHDSTFVYVSTNGTSWTKFDVNAPLLNNDYCAGNPDVQSINISAVAGGQSTVWVRFQFYSPSSMGASAGCAYAWMIDDVSIEDIPSDDVGILNTAYPSDYTVVPVLQVQPLNLSATVVNSGSAVANSVVLSAIVVDPSFNIVYSGTSSILSTLNAGDTSAYLQMTTPFTPTDTGAYYIQYIVSMGGADVNPNNDTSYAFLYVDDSLYASDYTIYDVNNFAGTIGIQGDIITIGQKFTVVQASQFTSATFYVNGPTLGDHVTVSVYDAVGGVPTNQVGVTNVYTITSADTGGAFITLPFTSPVNVTAGDYFVMLDQLDTNDISLGASLDIHTAGGVYFSIGGAAFGSLDAQGIEIALMLRVNNPSSTLNGISTPVSSKNLVIFPNPSNGIVNIQNNGSAAMAKVNVMNSMGQVVLSKSYNSLMNEKLDLSNQPDGVYTIQVRTADGITTQNIVISGK